jgi:drug/metabolite transporter (DMT)-like permease
VRPALAAAASGVLVGAAIVATRGVADQVGPASLALLRYAIGCACLLPIVLVTPRVRIASADLVPIALLGIGQFGILIVLLNFALQRIPSAQGALIFATVPLLTMLLSAALGQERLGWPNASGVLLSVAGVGLALGEDLIRSGWATEAWLGHAAVLASAMCAALCSVLYRPYLRQYAALPVSLFAMLAAVAFLALLAASEGFYRAWPVFQTSGWLAVIFIGVSSAIGYFCWLWALGHTTPTRVTVFLALSPITATILGQLLLAEGISMLVALGVVCVVLGLWLAHQQTLWWRRDTRAQAS